MKMIPADFKGKNNFVEETQYQNKRPLLTRKQILYYEFERLTGHRNCATTPRRSTSPGKKHSWVMVFKKTWRRTCSRVLYDKAMENHHFWKVLSHILLHKDPRNYQQLRAMVDVILEDQGQNLGISQEERLSDKASPEHPSKKRVAKRKDCRSWTSQSSCSKGGKCSLGHDHERKNMDKSHEARFSENSAENKVTKGRRNVLLGTNIVLPCC